MNIRNLIFVLLIASGLAGCSQKVQDKKGPDSAELKPESAHSADRMAPSNETKPALKFTAPSEWIVESPTSDIRKAQYKLPRAQGDSEDAQVVVYYFSGGGGTPQANIERWVGEVTGPDGKPATDAKISNKKVNGIALTIVDVKGTYASSMGMMQRSQPKTGMRLLGAIAETASGPWFIKLTGPERTVAKWQPSFDAFLASLKPGE